MTTKKSQKIPVIVCEFHQEVLQYIHRLIARKKLPFSGIKMVHFDSHPDLAYPDRLSADDCFCKEKMYYDLDIADWILPLMYAGHLNDLVWVKPPWADQIPEKELSFSVGKESETGYLRVTCKEDYFLEDCTFAPHSKLTNVKDVHVESVELSSYVQKIKSKENNFFITNTKTDGDVLNVKNDFTCNSDENQDSGLDLTINADSESKSQNQKSDSNKRISSQSSYNESQSKRTKTSLDKYVLDIDLDFFSVTNPFLQDYTEEQYQELKKAYEIKFPTCRNNDNEIELCVSEARNKLKSLKKTIDLVASGADKCENVKHETFFKFLQSLKTQKKDIDWEMVHNSGMTTQLPHHISTESEIDNLVEQMIMLLKELPSPAAITVARSTVDEYSPPNQIELIQEKVLTALKSVYSENILDLTYDYNDESRLL